MQFLCLFVIFVKNKLKWQILINPKTAINRPRAEQNYFLKESENTFTWLSHYLLLLLVFMCTGAFSLLSAMDIAPDCCRNFRAKATFLKLTRAK
jgi:hypothetical protein